MSDASGTAAAVCAIVMFAIFISAVVWLWWAERQYDKEHRCPNCREYTLVTMSDDAFDKDWKECISCGWYRYDG